MSERYAAYQAMPEVERPNFWTETPCPMSHPPRIIRRARRGDREAAADVLAVFERSFGPTSWCGVTREEMAELAAGDTGAVQARRRWKAQVRRNYSRNRAKNTRWSVSLDVEFRQGSYLSSHKEFSSLDAAMEWAERFKDDSQVLAEYLAELNAENRGLLGGHQSITGDYEMGPETQVRTLTVTREQLALPWYWIDDYEVWHRMAIEWRWESESYKALVAESDAEYEARKAQSLQGQPA